MASSSISGKLHDGAELLLAEASHRRCRLQGLKDASLHFGWVYDTEKRVITVEVSSTRSILMGDFLYLEVSGPRSLLTFIAYVAEIKGSFVSLQISSEIEQRALKSESRVRVRTIEGELGPMRNGAINSISIIDVSEHGFGFISQEPVEVTGPCRAVLCSIHARTDKSLAACRAGMLIMEMDRVSRARWARLLEG